MSNFFQNLFKSNEGSVIGIDVGSSSLKIVQIKKKHGRAVLETYGALSLGPYSKLSVGQVTNLPPDKIGEALIDLVRESNVTSLVGGLSIPFRSSLVSLIELPALGEKKLKEMIPIEARKYIPVPISEVTLDWWIVPSEHDNSLDFVENDDEEKRIKEAQTKKTEVLVVSIHNDVLTNYTTIVKQAKLEESFFEIEMFSSTRALLSGETQPVLIFDFGASSTKIYILERGVIKYSHVINRGSQEITMTISRSLGITFDQAEHIKRNLGSGQIPNEKNIYDAISLTLDYIFSEANSTVLNYQRKYNKVISKVILTGGGSNMKGVFEMAKANFQTEVVNGMPFSKVETPAFMDEVLKSIGMEFSVAIGVALRKLQEFT
ncbi:MAG: type IV pilus assembly protein PilM [bacterium]